MLSLIALDCFSLLSKIKKLRIRMENEAFKNIVLR